MISEAQAAEAVGARLPDGAYTISPHVAWLVADCVESPPLAEQFAHPMFTYFAGQGGIGATLDEMFALSHATAADGIMLGTAEIELHRPLEVGERYDVSGSIVDAQRKRGSSGTFDLVTYRMDLSTQDEPAATLTLAFVYPRRDAE